jgi:hypothetical protein
MPSQPAGTGASANKRDHDYNPSPCAHVFSAHGHSSAIPCQNTVLSKGRCDAATHIGRRCQVVQRMWCVVVDPIQSTPTMRHHFDSASRDGRQQRIRRGFEGSRVAWLAADSCKSSRTRCAKEAMDHGGPRARDTAQRLLRRAHLEAVQMGGPALSPKDLSCMCG